MFSNITFDDSLYDNQEHYFGRVQRSRILLLAIPCMMTKNITFGDSLYDDEEYFLGLFVETVTSDDSVP